MTRCPWCGDDHDPTALCQRAQRQLTRRSFCFLFGAGTAGLLLAPPQLLTAETIEQALGEIRAQCAPPNLGQLVADAWNAVIGQQLEDNMFETRSFYHAMRTELKRRDAHGSRPTGDS